MTNLIRGILYVTCFTVIALFVMYICKEVVDGILVPLKTLIENI